MSSKFGVVTPRDTFSVAVVADDNASYCEHSHCIVHSSDYFVDDDVST